MAIKTTLNYSPNFDPKKRKTNQIKFIDFSLHWNENRISRHK